MKRHSHVWLVMTSPLLLALGTALTIPFLVGMAASDDEAPAAVAGIPQRVLEAYQAADAWCEGLRWELLAGVGWVESGHGTFGGASADEASGAVRPLILGPPLDGSEGVEAHPVGQWAGMWGLEGEWEQAVGPMQFRPPTFDAWSVDIDFNGVADPHDIDDAVASAANYLCEGPDGQIASEREALLRYNNSETYVNEVLAYADRLANQAVGGMLCPIAGPTTFTDTWLAPRSGGRQHLGVDMFADSGTPVVAPAAGIAEHGSNELGGLAFSLWADDGTYYYGAHLSAYGAVTGQVEAGTILGYVGSTGNAQGTSPHLHFEMHPNRPMGASSNPVNPTPATAAACADELV
jgi:murein DD-endopeptidase MepM/ murein hydrolase activator NlpD